MATSNFTATHFASWYGAAGAGPYATFRSGTYTQYSTTALTHTHPYRSLAWFDAAAITTALSGKTVTAMYITLVSDNESRETSSSVGVRLYRTNLTYNGSNAGYNNLNTEIWTTGMTYANPYNSYMLDYAETPAFAKGGTLTAGLFATGTQAQDFATALKAGYAIGTWDIKPGSRMSTGEKYKTRIFTTAPVLTIKYETALTKVFPPLSQNLPGVVTDADIVYVGSTTSIYYDGAQSGGPTDEIVGYSVKYLDSADNTWTNYTDPGAWTTLSTIAATTGSGVLTSIPAPASGYYRRYQLAVVGETNTSIYQTVLGRVLRCALPAQPSVTITTNGLRMTAVITCSASVYGLWDSIRLHKDGSSSYTQILGVPPAGITYTYTENCTAGAHSYMFRRANQFGNTQSKTVTFTCTANDETSTDWFKWNGANSKDYGVYVLTHPDPERAAERVEYKTVIGRHGYVAVPEGDYAVYSTLEKTLDIYLADGNFDEVRGWLTGQGEIEFANEKGYVYSGYLSSAIPYEKVMRGHIERRATVTFTCQPYKIDADEALITLPVSGRYITNMGNIPSRPIVTVYGDGDGTLTIGTQTMTLNGISDSLVLDCLEQTALNAEGEEYGGVDDDFFEVPTGSSIVSWTGGISYVTIQPRWGMV
jgi:phage-related protein